MKIKFSLILLLTTMICAQSEPIRLSKQQIEQYHRDGYLLIKGALRASEVAQIKQTVDDVINAYVTREYSAQFAQHAHGKDYFNIRNTLEYTDKLDYLIDYPNLINMVTTLMGTDIRLVNFNLFVRGPCSQQNALNNKLAMFHVDVGASYKKIANKFPMQINLQVFLTDMTDDYQGNFMAIPGTHLPQPGFKLNGYAQLPECNGYLEKGQLPPGTIQIKAQAGDILLHSTELWHAVAPNYSKNIRKSIGIRYGQKQLKEYHLPVTPHILQRMTARQRSLLNE